MTSTSPKDWRDKIAIKNALVDALRYDLRGFATDVDSRTDIDRAVDFIIKFAESIEREAEERGYSNAMSADINKIIKIAKRETLEELRGEIKAYPLEELMPFTKKDIIYLLDTKIKEL